MAYSVDVKGLCFFFGIFCNSASLIITFQSNSVMAPTRISRWIVSVGLRMAELQQFFIGRKKGTTPNGQPGPQADT